MVGKQFRYNIAWRKLMDFCICFPSFYANYKIKG